MSERSADSSESKDAGPTGGTEAKASGSALGGAVRFLGRHPVGVIQGIVFVLIAVVVLQNLDPMRIDILFWSVAEVPKLVLILIAMLVGAAAWEILRRALRRR